MLQIIIDEIVGVKEFPLYYILYKWAAHSMKKLG